MSRRPERTKVAGAHAVAWAAAALWASIGCSYYSEDLLSELAPAEGGAPSGGTDARGGGGAGGGPVSGGGNGGVSGTNGTAGGGSPSGGTSSPPDGAGAGPEQGGAAAGGASDAGGDAADTGDGGGGGESEPPPDACPTDESKVAPGKCGCGVPETCAPIKEGLAHRYTFEQAGTAAVDSVGDADAAIIGASAAMGQVVFGGTNASYVNLPNGIVSSLKNASFEIWLTWGGGAPWQRIFDFGTNDKGEGSQGEGTTYLYLSPSDGSAGNPLRASFSLKGVNSETVVRAAAPLSSGTMQHLALVVDDTNNELRLYLNGSVAALTGFSQSLASLKDVNNWIGRSNFADAPLKATIEEVRIYKVAMTQAQVAASYGFGPNPSFL